IEVIESASDELILLVGNGGFATIQAALDYADGRVLAGMDLKVNVEVGPGARPRSRPRPGSRAGAGSP
ncbi:MAG: hypothetical protein KA297_13845, partial [Kofleriaceae bacterium]|nr:hypothetical protein [Kofleriaceae bacterium]